MLVFGRVVVDAAATDTLALTLTVPLVAVIVAVPVPAVLLHVRVVDAVPALLVVALVGLTEHPATPETAKVTVSPGVGLPALSRNVNVNAQLEPGATDVHPLLTVPVAGGVGYASATA